MGKMRTKSELVEDLYRLMFKLQELERTYRGTKAIEEDWYRGYYCGRATSYGLAKKFLTEELLKEGVVAREFLISAGVIEK